MQKTVYKPTRKKTDNKHSSVLTLFLKSIFIQIVVFTVVSIVSLAADINCENYYAVCICSFSFGSLLSGFTVCRTIRKKGMINGVIYSLPSVGIAVLASICLNCFRIDLTMLISLISMIVFSGVGGVLSVNIKKKTKIN